MPKWQESVQDFFKETEVEYRIAVPFSELSYIKLGGVARAIALPDTEEKLIKLLGYLSKAGIKHKTVGRMTNILPPSGVYDGVVIKTDRSARIHTEGVKVTAEAGRGLPSLASELCARGLSGFERLSGIPASVGGAVCMNAGAYGCEIAELLTGARIYDSSRDTDIYMTRDELDFSYRHSKLGEGTLVLLSADFICTPSDPKDIVAEMRRCAEKRRQTQPTASLSLGSVFKRYNGQSAGYYIDRAGLKGLAVGGAEVSRKHAGFIINNGHATADDFRRLVELVKMRVFGTFGVMLEEEVEYLE